MATSAPTPTLPAQPTTASGAAHGGAADPSIHQKGREKVPWPKSVWDAIDMHVHDEIMRTHIGGKFLPHRKVHPKTMSVAADVITYQELQGETTQTLIIDEGASIRVNEIWTEFALTPQQVHETAEAHEVSHTAAVTLGVRAANFLARAQDLVIFQGVNAYYTNFFETYVRFRSGQQPNDTGLLSYPVVTQSPPVQASGSIPLLPDHIIPVSQATDIEPIEGPGVLYGSNTFAAVSQAYSTLQQYGHYGPYVLVLHTVPYADAYAPLYGLVITADRIKPLMEAGFFGTGTLVANPPSSPIASPPVEPAYTGILMSLGGDVADLVVGHHATTTFMQEDPDGNFRFRVLWRGALRLKDSTGVVRLEFQ